MNFGANVPIWVQCSYDVRNEWNLRLCTEYSQKGGGGTWPGDVAKLLQSNCNLTLDFKSNLVCSHASSASQIQSVEANHQVEVCPVFISISPFPS